MNKRTELAMWIAAAATVVIAVMVWQDRDRADREYRDDFARSMAAISAGL